MAENICIFGAPINALTHLAMGLEAVGMTHQPPEDLVPPGAVARAAERVQRKLEDLHSELRFLASGWVYDGAEGIEGVVFGDRDEDDKRDDWQGEDAGF